jgi:hypothetical protein
MEGTIERGRDKGGGNDVMWKYGKHSMFPTFPHHLENDKAVSHISTTTTTLCTHFKIKERIKEKTYPRTVKPKRLLAKSVRGGSYMKFLPTPWKVSFSTLSFTCFLS